MSLTGRRGGMPASLRAEKEPSDPLTGLPGSAALRAWADGEVEAGAFGVLLLDVDNLRTFNRSFGYAEGDRLLQSVAERLAANAPADARIFRLEDDAFAVLLPGAFGRGPSTTMLDTLLKAVSAPYPKGATSVAMSAGFALRPLHARRNRSLLDCARRALASAKAAGGGQCRVYDRELVSDDDRLPVSRDELERAWRLGEWTMAYQPQRRLSDRSVVGAEALLRWRHPTRGLLSPLSFLDQLEADETARLVGLWVLETACRDLASWRRAGVRVPRVSVNLFAEQLADPGLPTAIAAILARRGLGARDLEIEVTENIALKPESEEIENLRILVDRGVAVSLDDFGTGYASLTTLRAAPLTGLKIDRSFVRNLSEGSADLAVVRAILAIGRDLGLRVIAEGVEYEHEARRLLELGCTEFQGYLGGRPTSTSLFIRQAKV